MNCPRCGSRELKVNESRDLKSGSAIRRRRECLSCSYRFTTYERVENPSIMVIKRSGGKEPYNKEKIISGLKKAFEKRAVSDEEIELIANDIDRKINLLGEDEIESSVIGEIVLESIKKVDEVAYLRFASVYKNFQDAKSFQKEAEFIDGDLKS